MNFISIAFPVKGWNLAQSMCKSGNDNWALYAKSVLDRTRLALASKGEQYDQVLQPSAEYLGSLLGVDQSAVRYSLHSDLIGFPSKDGLNS